MEFPVEIEIGKVVTELHWALNNKANQVLAKHGITVEQVKMLHIIDTNPGCEQNFLAEQTRKVKSAITKLINKMSEEGLVARTTSALDARTNAIYITGKGEKLLELGTQDLMKTLSEIFKNNQSELIETIDAMKRLIHRLE